MVTKKPLIVIIGAGMAGLAAANKLYTSVESNDLFELCIVEGGNRIGGRINTTEFGGDSIEMGATWIHGIGGSPVYKIAQQIGALDSERPWERLDGFPEDPLVIAEGGFELDSSIVDPISSLYRRLMDFAQGKSTEECENSDEFCKIAAKAAKLCLTNGCRELSIGSFLRRGLEDYWVLQGDKKNVKYSNNWTLKALEEAIFAMQENVERTYTSAGDLSELDFNAESEYKEFPDEEITIAKGYSSVIQSLASVLPLGLIQLGRKVKMIVWNPESFTLSDEDSRPVKLHFDDGSVMVADHVIVTVSLGVLKAGIRKESSIFSPQLPSFKTEAISRLGFGVVNKVFLQLNQEEDDDFKAFPYLQMVFEQSLAPLKQGKIPWWMRRTVSLCPIYKKSKVLLSWFAGREALELELLSDEEVIMGVTKTLSNFCTDLMQPIHQAPNSHLYNGNSNGIKRFYRKFAKVLKSGWGTDPLFMGSYSFVAVGSSGDDLDSMAEPLPEAPTNVVPPLQLLFAGEATHRTHYSTTHGAYFSGIREANRLIQHYSWGIP
ncbi:polyamine oxidase 5 [Tasmannia lanceolata]|uniref:polyamine oxidase 5 n=1 Tax=Tasmannia lanceolata TaxID=3420 RepID=UPI0040637607